MFSEYEDSGGVKKSVQAYVDPNAAEAAAAKPPPPSEEDIKAAGGEGHFVVQLEYRLRTRIALQMIAIAVSCSEPILLSQEVGDALAFQPHLLCPVLVCLQRKRHNSGQSMCDS